MTGAVLLDHGLLVASGLFAIGLIGVLVRRNLLFQLLSIEIMLNAVNVALAAFARHHGGLDGQILVFFVMAVAAAEAAVRETHEALAASEQRLADANARIPEHDVPAALIAEIDELDEELEQLRAQRAQAS